jgi:C4-dicarboxylate transporter DctM subunit
MMAALVLGAALLLIALRVNLVLVLIATAGAVHMIWGQGNLLYLPQDIWTTITREALVAVPLFILVGLIMGRGAIAQRLIAIMAALTRGIPAGLALATVLSCAVFSAISGSSLVTLLAVSSVLFPALTQNGYSRGFAIGALCAGATLGIIIPPSVPMVIYAVLREVSIADLFLAGVMPGLLLTGGFGAYALIANRHIPRGQFSGQELWHAIRQGFPALLLPVILLGGIYSGRFSVVEAAAVALLVSVLIETLIFRDLGLRDGINIATEAAKLLGAIFPLIAVAASMGLLLNEHRVPQDLVELATSHMESQTGFLLVSNLFLLLVGCVMDTTSALSVLTPVLGPMAQAYGVDPIHFGIIMVLNLEIGILTPPFGLNIIIAASVFRESFWTVCKAVLPFVAIMLGVLLLVTFQPWIALAILG